MSEKSKLIILVVLIVVLIVVAAVQFLRPRRKVVKISKPSAMLMQRLHVAEVILPERV